jgi:hypothetical protein
MTFRESAVSPKEAAKMSEQDRDRKWGNSEGDEPDDVEAHKHSGRGATDDEGDDVEAHKHSGRGATDDDDGDDVDAHMHTARG